MHRLWGTPSTHQSQCFILFIYFTMSTLYSCAILASVVHYLTEVVFASRAWDVARAGVRSAWQQACFKKDRNQNASLRTL